MSHLNSIRLLDMSLILFRDKGFPSEDSEHRRIDIWWRGRDNGSLMVLMAHLLRLNWEWAGAKIRLLRLIEDEAGRQPATKALRVLVEAARVDADVEVLVSEAPFMEVLHRHSKEASLVMLGFNVPEESDAESFRNYFEKLLSELPTTLMVCSSGEADLMV